MARVKVTLLGTGMPQPDVTRRGPSQVIDVDGELALVDCGAGTLHRLLEAGYTGRGLRTIALTHLHSDHITGLADLLWAGWLQHWWDPPPTIVGPPGTAAHIGHLMEAYDYDITVRSREGAMTRATLVPEVVEVEDGWRSATDSWSLSAFRVDHAPVDQAFGFRLDAEPGSVVVSGDTRRSANLIRSARGADLLVHEVIWRAGMERLMATAPAGPQRARWERVLSYHTPADELGGIASSSEVGQLVLSHIIVPGGTADDLLADARRGYDGPVEVGKDLATFTVERRL